MIIDNQSGKILCTGINSSNENPTYHGEMVAINHCATEHPHLDWSKTTLITDAEPCSMCASAIVWANISKIVYGTSIDFLLQHHWDQINISTQYVIDHSPWYKGTVIKNVLHDQTDLLFKESPSTHIRA